MSSLAWIDFDEAERQRAQRIMALFQERESRDELGLGAIRDSIADHLFPGTSTIQTRLRYMLFIPWLFRQLESRTLSEAQLRIEARRLETVLISALITGGETSGVFGIDAGARLQRLPSSVYWAGLGAWGIRTFPGSIESLFTTLSDRGRLRAPTDREDALANSSGRAIWHPTLMEIPSRLLDHAVFRLTADEAQFLTDRLVASQPTSLLTMLAKTRSSADCDFIWTHPHLSAFAVEAGRLVQHGRIFSELMHGAALLYNLTLSEMRQNDEWIESYRGRLKNWTNELKLAEIDSWSLDDFWHSVAHQAHVIGAAAKRFVIEWREIVCEGSGTVMDSTAARRLVEARERRLKASHSRYANHAVRDRWTGAAGVDRFTYRWRQVKSHLKDLVHAD